MAGVMLETTLLGLGTVFAVLAVIYLMMVLLRILFAKLDKTAPAVAPIAAPPAAAAASEEELAAVVLAVAQVMEKDPAELNVRNIRKL